MDLGAELASREGVFEPSLPLLEAWDRPKSLLQIDTHGSLKEKATDER
jgi:hypothetical protein